LPRYAEKGGINVGLLTASDGVWKVKGELPVQTVSKAHE
jgi:hypothetical protein